jgi:hypothetical protein
MERVQKTRKGYFDKNGNRIDASEVLYCGRPFYNHGANPIKLVKDMIYINASYRRGILDPWVYMCNGDLRMLLDLYEGLLTGEGLIGSDYFYWQNRFKEIDFNSFKNYKYLACWCKLTEKCHVDLIIKKLEAPGNKQP